MYPLKLEPIYDKTIWANNKLTTIRNIKEEGLGTCWEVSAHPYAQNKIINGIYKGKNLSELISEHTEDMLGKHTMDQMLRLAYLDAKDDLSIQVHPGTEYAMKYENDLGKTESWYVLEAEENATLVAGTLCNDEQIIRDAIKNGTLEKYLRKVNVKAGDFIFVESGMLHALGSGILAIEVGTNSNTTYRFYDYGRKDKSGNERPLHLEKSFDVVDLEKQSEVISTPFEKRSENFSKTLVDSDDFVVILYDVVNELTLDTLKENFHCLTFVDKDATIVHNNKEIDVKFSESLFVPASCGSYQLKGNFRVLLSYVK